MAEPEPGVIKIKMQRPNTALNWLKGEIDAHPIESKQCFGF